MYKLNKTLLYLFILTLVGAGFSATIIVRAYEAYDFDYTEVYVPTKDARSQR